MSRFAGFGCTFEKVHKYIQISQRHTFARVPPTPIRWAYGWDRAYPWAFRYSQATKGAHPAVTQVTHGAFHLDKVPLELPKHGVCVF